MPSGRAERKRVSPWRSRAFGVNLELNFVMPALIAADTDTGAPDCRLELVADEEIDTGWPLEEARLRGLMGDDRAKLEIHEHQLAGYLINSSMYGRFRVSRDGTSVRCAPKAKSPDETSDWYWWSFLIGQALPLVAALHGLEVLHASAVVIDGSACAFSGVPGAGKSTLAINLALGGSPLLSDDVVALHVEDDRVIAEPGSALVNLCEDQVDQMKEMGTNQLGNIIGASHKVHLRADRLAPPMPLGALYLLELAPPQGVTTINRKNPVDPRDLLSATFVPYVSFAQRVIAQLEIAALIERSVPVFKVEVDRRVGPDALARKIHSHASEL